MKKNRDQDDREMCESMITGFAEHFFLCVEAHKESNKASMDQSEQEQSSETKKRRHSTDQDEENMKTTDDRSVKSKVTVELLNPDNLAEFNQDFKNVNLDRDMSKPEAAEIRKQFEQFMERYYADPSNVHPELNDCELRSLAHVDPGMNIKEHEFSFSHADEAPTMEEFREAQDPSGYPLRLPLGIKKLRCNDDPDLIKSFTDILGSLMQATDGPIVGFISREKIIHPP